MSPPVNGDNITDTLTLAGRVKAQLLCPAQNRSSHGGGSSWAPISFLDGTLPTRAPACVSFITDGSSALGTWGLVDLRGAQVQPPPCRGTRVYPRSHEAVKARRCARDEEEQVPCPRWDRRPRSLPAGAQSSPTFCLRNLQRQLRLARRQPRCYGKCSWPSWAQTVGLAVLLGRNEDWSSVTSESWPPSHPNLHAAKQVNEMTPGASLAAQNAAQTPPWPWSWPVAFLRP